MKNSTFALAVLAGGCLLMSLQPIPEARGTEAAPDQQAAATDFPAQPTLPSLPAARASDGLRLDDENREAAKRRMTRAVQALAEAGGSKIVDLVIAYDGSNFEDEATRIRALGGHILGRYDSLGMMNVRIPAAQLYAMAGSETLTVADLKTEPPASSLSARAAMTVPKRGSVQYASSLNEV